MLIHRNYKYRLYPRPEQDHLLRKWEGTLRFLWNLCNTQRLMGLSRSKGEKIYLRDVHKDKDRSQNKQMTNLLEEYSWIAEVECHARQKTLSDLDEAWQRCFKLKAGQPRFKHRGDELRIFIPISVVKCSLIENGKSSQLSFDSVRYTPLGALKLVLDRPTVGTITSWSLKREGDEWYAIAACEVSIPDPTSVNDKAIGIDRGIAKYLADSDGRFVENIRSQENLQQQLTRAQRKASRKKKGSKNRARAYKRVGKIQRRAARQREILIGTESLYYAKNYGIVCLERLNIKGMSASASGTIEEPGKNVAQKSGLNRVILDAAWGKFATATKYKVDERGGSNRECNPATTSQDCPDCKYSSPNNRKTQADFTCVQCGYSNNADTVGAINIKEQCLTNPLPPKTKTKISTPKRRPKSSTVKPTVVQPEEDNLTAALEKPNAQRSDEPGTKACEGFPRISCDPTLQYVEIGFQ